MFQTPSKSLLKPRTDPVSNLAIKKKTSLNNTAKINIISVLLFSASLLNSVGLAELVAHTHKQYEDIAIKLANNPIRLKEIKNELEKNKLEKPLFNTKLFTKHIESAYTQMYKKYIKNEKPDHIKIQ